MIKVNRNDRGQDDATQLTISGLIALFVLAMFGVLIALGMSISGSELDSQTELSARCRSLGGQMGNGKCFKDGKEV
nr:MAG TPA: hypothetical protein [Caudoviricetes sp.]